jgi:LemA protein
MRNVRMVSALALAFGLTGCGYNRIQTLDEQVNKGKQNIAVQLQRRSDLVPNLVEVVRGVAKQESEVFTAIADARSRLAGAAKPDGDLKEMAGAANQLNGALARLLVIQENYPQLRSMESFRGLSDELAGSENRVATARTDYNTVVAEYNEYIRKFPAVMTAKVMGMKARDYFELESPAAAKAPKVDLTTPTTPKKP